MGDSLFHGIHFFRREFDGMADGFNRRRPHHYAIEDTMPSITFSVGSITRSSAIHPTSRRKDAAMRDAFREIYDESCYRSYALSVPFIERFFDLAQHGTRNESSGFVGLIVSNSFMKREFGVKLIEKVLPRLDLTHVVDCSGAYIPGHGTPTAILFGRNRRPSGDVVRSTRAHALAPLRRQRLRHLRLKGALDRRPYRCPKKIIIARHDRFNLAG